MGIYTSIRRISLIATLCIASIANAEVPINYKADIIGTLGSGDFAPYYISSLNHGIVTQSDNALLRMKAWKPLSTDTRFSYGFGVDFLTGWSSSVDYLKYNFDTKKFIPHSEKPAYIWLQQLYGEVKYRGVFLTVGLKEQQSKILNNKLTSGDLIESGNSRPIPEVRAGFIDFQNIPFTNGWVQICGEISYGKVTDNDWVRNHYNHYNSHISQDTWYSYKRAYFRTKPSERFSVTIGAQAAAQFGGYTENYRNGENFRTDHRTATIKDMFEMFIPRLSDKEGFVAGNHLGSWDFMARYRLKNDDELKAYFQWPWEDGSGIGKLNGFDGIWGIEYKKADKGWLNGAVIEYLDFTNQSGPLHWASADCPGTTITDQATGGDEYYNNAFYNSYAHYGMAIGSPFLRSPIYNTDGYPMFVDNLVRGFHVGLMGNINSHIDYRLLGGYRKAWGDGRIPRANAVENTSFMAEVNYNPPTIKGLSVKAQVAFDQGSMFGNNFGSCVTVTYNGLLNLGKK